jgi:transposase
MQNVIMIGCDLHDKNMLLKIAVNRDPSVQKVVPNTAVERARMIKELKAMAEKKKAKEILFAYEASGLGYQLHDELKAAGVDCRVLAPTKMKKSHKQKSNKTDAKDAEDILEILKAHKLAGNKLPEVRVPSPQQREDLEVTRARADLTSKQTRVKAQIRALLKRSGIEKRAELGSGWTQKWRAQLDQLCKKGLSVGAATALKSLMRQLESLQEEIAEIDAQLRKLAKTERHKKQVKALTKLPGVGIFTAVTFLTEMGDLKRFNNRRQVASYAGLSPSSNESGLIDNRKGHITRQGPSRLRRVLCQAVWARVRSDPKEKECYEKLKAKNPGKSKIGIVAVMRRLTIKMWHVAKDAAA